jgi:hypothetical protein
LDEADNLLAMKKSILIPVVIILIATGCRNSEISNPDPVNGDMLVEGFRIPPDSVKPWVYWYWISDNNTKEGITKDLEAMADAGIGEAMIGNIGYEGMPYGETRILSEDWWQLIEHTVREGKRTGVNIGLFNCPGWSQSGGPWVKPEESMRYLVSSEVRIEGGKKIIINLKKPQSSFQDARVLAFPLPAEDALTISAKNPVISSNPEIKDLDRLIDGNTETSCFFKVSGSSDKITFDLSTSEPFTARSLSIFPSSVPMAADMDLQVPEQEIYKSVKKFRYDRTNERVNVGPMPFGPVTVSIPEVTSRKFKLVLNNFSLSNYFSSRDNSSSLAGLSEIEISSAPRVDQFVEKQLGKMCQTPFPLWNEYKWKTVAESGSREMRVDPARVTDISRFLTKDDTLRWDAPEGRWIIIRIGATPTGARNAQAAPYAVGWEVDKMNRGHLTSHFNAYIGELLRRMPAEDRTALKHVVLDSYEQGSQNWTDNLVEDFITKYGYDPTPWLPALSGRVVGSADQSDRFLWDLRRLVADRIAYDYVGGFHDLCQQQGLRIWLENYGHWGFPSEFLMYGGQSHDVAGEFWNEGELGNIECRAASSAAHIYGKRLVSAESYTSAGLAYQRYPAMLKKRGDWSYTEGINQVVLHLYIHQPYENKNPGINAWFGTEFNRKNTWFSHAKSWIDYQRRCMFMLRRGLVVNDVCYFIGEDVPVMTGARIPELPKGYSYDYINTEVILHRLTVKDGRLMLPDGMSYKLMILPPLETMRPEVLKKIKELADMGASFYGPPPSHSPSLQNYPAADEEVKSLVSYLWDDGNKNHVRYGTDLQTVLDHINVRPDVSAPDSIPILWIHRRMKDCDIYFITNQGDNRISFNARFRVTGKQPELWEPLNGTIRNLRAFSQKNGGTEIPMQLDSAGSLFIVFRNNGKATENENRENFPQPYTLLQINTPWEVTFDKLMGGPDKTITMEFLTDWTTYSDERIKYYSGSAVYRSSFHLEEIPEGHQLFADLGKVHVLAELKINGKYAGGIWTSPWKADITDLVKTGENSIEVVVVNNWINRLIGDSMKKENKRITWVNENPAKPGDPLQPSGLIGPVTVESVRY